MDWRAIGAVASGILGAMWIPSSSSPGHRLFSKVHLRRYEPLDSSWPGYLASVAGVAIAALIRWYLGQFFGENLPPYMTFYPTVMLSALAGGFLPGLLATALSAFAVAHLFLPPEGSLALERPGDAAGMFLFVLINLLLSVVAGALRRARLRDRASARDLRQMLKLQDLAPLIVRDLNGKIVRWTEGCQNLYGISAEDALGKTTEEILHTRYPEPIERIRAKLFRDGYWEGELVQRCPAGHELTVWSRWVLWRNQRQEPQAILKIDADITERKAAEAALRESEERLRTVTESADIGHWDWQIDKQRLEWSPICKRLFAIPADEPMTYERFMEALHPEDRERTNEAVQACLNRKDGVFDVEYRAVWPGGTVLWLHSRGKPTYDASGQAVRLAGVVMDITRRKQIETELKAARDSAEQAKMAVEASSKAKDQFMAVLSHELRTPLTPVVTALDMLEDRDDLDRDTIESVRMIRRNVELEARLIDDLLDVTRIAQGKIELQRKPVALGELIHRAVEVIQPEIRARSLHFGIDGEETPLAVIGDATRLSQVFWNLLRNAVKFTPNGGCVGVFYRSREGQAVVEIRDSGTGIEAEALPRIFQPFEQADRSVTRQFGGLGLGLTISKALVELHGGTIEASSPGKGMGATFRVTLPVVVQAQAHPEHPEPVQDVAQTAGGLRILLVEDHADTARILQRLLQKRGYQVDLAGSIDRALDAVSHKPFDLLISDLGLPDGSGVELMRWLRQNGHHLPGIALSGYGQEEDVRRSREAGFATHLVKPANAEQLSKAIEAAAGERGRRILIVDDEPEFVQTMSKLLERRGFDVKQAGDGEEALGLLSSGLDVQAILMDERMPRLTGTQAFAELRARGIKTPVVLVSAMENVRSVAKSHGFNAALRKPVSILELMETVDAIVPKTSAGVAA